MKTCDGKLFFLLLYFERPSDGTLNTLSVNTYVNWCSLLILYLTRKELTEIKNFTFSVAPWSRNDSQIVCQTKI